MKKKLKQLICPSDTTPFYAENKELKGSIVFSQNGSFSIADGVKMHNGLAENFNTTPHKIDGQMWFPITPFAYLYGHKSYVTVNSYLLYFSYKRHEYFFFDNQNTFLCDGERISLPFSTKIFEGTLYFPDNFLCEFFGIKYTYYDELSGICIFSNHKKIYTEESLPFLFRLSAETCLSNPTAKEVLNDLENAHLTRMHGKFFLTTAEWTNLRNAIKSDIEFAELERLMKASIPLGKAKTIPQDFLPNTQEDSLFSLLLGNAFYYRLTGNRHHLDEAQILAKNLINMEKWSEDFALNIHIAYILSLTYDFCFAGLSEGEKAEYEKALLRLCLRPILKLADENTLFVKQDENECLLASKLLVLGLALSSAYPESAKKIICVSLQFLSNVYPILFNGKSEKNGASKSAILLKSYALTTSILQSTGVSYGFSQLIGPYSLAKTLLVSETTNGLWSESQIGVKYDDEFASFFASKWQDISLIWLRRQNILKGKKSISPFDLLYYTPLKNAEAPRIMLDAYFDNGDVLLRSSFNDDANFFAIDRKGICVLELDGNRILSYLPNKQSAMQIDASKSATCSFPLFRRDFKKDSSMAILNIASIDKNLIRAYRGIALKEGRKTAILQDEITSEKGYFHHFSFFVEGDIAITNEGKNIETTINNTKYFIDFSGIYNYQIVIEKIENATLCTICETVEKTTHRVSISITKAENAQNIPPILPLSKW